MKVNTGIDKGDNSDYQDLLNNYNKALEEIESLKNETKVKENQCEDLKRDLKIEQSRTFNTRQDNERLVQIIIHQKKELIEKENQIKIKDSILRTKIDLQEIQEKIDFKFEKIIGLIGSFAHWSNDPNDKSKNEELDKRLSSKNDIFDRLSLCFQILAKDIPNKLLRYRGEKMEALDQLMESIEKNNKLIGDKKEASRNSALIRSQYSMKIKEHFLTYYAEEKSKMRFDKVKPNSEIIKEYIRRHSSSFPKLPKEKTFYSYIPKIVSV